MDFQMDGFSKFEKNKFSKEWISETVEHGNGSNMEANPLPLP